MRILQIDNQQGLVKLLKDIKVDPYGIKIMLPKAFNYLIQIDSLSNISANILKQEMLSLGADAAIARDSLTGRSKTTGCLLMGNLAQFDRLKEKLNRQPFGLRELAGKLARAISNYRQEKYLIDLGRVKLRLEGGVKVMGIMNLTPDSFSGDGLYRSSVEKIVEFAQRMVADGADIIDIGAESSRPGAMAVSIKEEIKRVIPAIKAIAKEIKVPISVDTAKPEVAKQALDSGASLINDITGLKNPKMRRVAAAYKAAVVIMHMQGNPRTMQRNPKYKSLFGDIIEYLSRAIDLACASGIKKEKIIIDPGIGFGKTVAHNLEILSNLRELKILGRPILVGPSRKSFLGKILNAQTSDRLYGTVSSCVLAAERGAGIVRTHDVKPVKDALKVGWAVRNYGETRRKH